MAASSFWWRRTAATAYPHAADGGRIPDFAFAEQAAAGLVTTAPDLARFVAAALSGPDGEPRDEGWSARPGCGWRSPPPPAPRAAGGLATAWGSCLLGSGWPTTRAPTGAGGPALALLPDRRAGMVVLANSDAGSAPVDAVVQQWVRRRTTP